MKIWEEAEEADEADEAEEENWQQLAKGQCRLRPHFLVPTFFCFGRPE